MTLQIAVTCDDNYAEPAMLALYSAMAHMTDTTDVSLHYFTPQNASGAVLDAVGQHLSAFEHAFGASTHLRAVDLAMQMSENPNKPKSSALFFRLYFSQFFDGHVLYLDPDVLVLGDVREHSAGIDLNGLAFAAAPDAGLVRRVKKFLGPIGRIESLFGRTSAGSRLVQLLGDQAAKNYFNSGVMLFDMERWKALDCDQKIADMGDIGRLEYRDQDALNVLATQIGGYCQLADGWNVQTTKTMPTDVSPIVRHYTGPKKPWLDIAKTETGARLSWANLYWDWQARFATFRQDHGLKPI